MFYFYSFFLTAFALCHFLLSPKKIHGTSSFPSRHSGNKSRSFSRVKSALSVLWLGYLLLPKILVLPVKAQPFTHDGATWTGIQTVLRFKETPLSLTGFVQVRVIENSTAFQTTVLSGLLGYRVSPEVSVALGYTALTPINNRILEIAFLQGLLEVRIGKISIPIRGRAEWRWFSGVNNFDDLPPGSWRFRIRADAVIPLTESLSSVVNNEFFFLPEPQFFNQNRFQVGPRFIFSPQLSLDVLYQNRILSSLPGASNRMEHTLLTMLTVRLDSEWFAPHRQE